ncbi:hypothetical protein ACV242_005503 [Peribacillus simplex]
MSMTKKEASYLAKKMIESSKKTGTELKRKSLKK